MFHVEDDWSGWTTVLRPSIEDSGSNLACTSITALNSGRIRYCIE